MKNIFEGLNRRKVVFAVGIAVCTFKNPAVDGQGRDYYIMISKNDKEKVKSLGFRQADESKFGILERDLNHEEIFCFNKIKKDFVKVQDDRDGKVYELKDNSFKKYYKQYGSRRKNT